MSMCKRSGQCESYALRNLFESIFEQVHAVCCVWEVHATNVIEWLFSLSTRRHTNDLCSELWSYLHIHYFIFVQCKHILIDFNRLLISLINESRSSLRTFYECYLLINVDSFVVHVTLFTRFKWKISRNL